MSDARRSEVICAALAVLLALPGCAIDTQNYEGGAESVPAVPTSELDAGLMPPPLDPDESDTTSTSVPAVSGRTAAESAGEGVAGPTGETTRGRPAGNTTKQSPQQPFKTVGRIDDPRGDQGLEGPGYADIVKGTIEDNRVTARVTVDVAEDIPLRLQAGEVMGVAVDLWRKPSQRESDYQLFAEGGEHGWFAHLQTPRGLVRYPGMFSIGGRRLVFEISWDQLGGLRSGGFRALADWSQRRAALNAASQDRVPDKSPAQFRR